MIENQFFLFLIFIVNGILIGILFDFFRILRKSFKTNDFFTYLEDIIFWIITGIILLYSIFTFNNGEIRFFMFIGVLVGIILYILSISSFIIKINVTILTFFKNIIIKIFNCIIFPIKEIGKFIKKVLFDPILSTILNIKKSNIKQKMQKKMKEKKEFW